MKLSAFYLSLASAALFLTPSAATDEPRNISKEQEIAMEACMTCERLVDSFHNGIVRTARSQYDGGDSAWERRKLGAYANSELRLIEIQEELCQEVRRRRERCLEFAEVWEEELEKWWLKEQEEYPDLREYLCFNITKACGRTPPEGWTTDMFGMWVDLNECEALDEACAAGEFCVNTQGSYTCHPCDPICKTCDGEGPDMCREYFNPNMKGGKSSLGEIILYAVLVLTPILIYRRYPKLCLICGCSLLLYGWLLK